MSSINTCNAGQCLATPPRKWMPVQFAPKMDRRALRLQVQIHDVFQTCKVDWNSINQALQPVMLCLPVPGACKAQQLLPALLPPQQSRVGVRDTSYRIRCTLHAQHCSVHCKFLVTSRSPKLRHLLPGGCWHDLGAVAVSTQKSRLERYHACA